MFMAQSGRRRTEDERVFAIKPMNCPGHIQIFKHGLRSYRELPLRMAEFGLVHRYEPSGALHGLMRVRAFTQDDAHVFCTQEQMADECLKINDLILSTYADFGFEGDLTVKLSTRPEKRVGTDEAWDHAEGIMQDVLKQIAHSNNRIKTRSIRAKARSTGRSSNTCCATPSAATGNAAPRRSTSTCRSASMPSTSPPTARKKRR
jgi:threonyl-tRNA synthetase